MKPRLTPAGYEDWFVATVTALLTALHPTAVGVFYQTDGRESAEGGT